MTLTNGKSNYEPLKLKEEIVEPYAKVLTIVTTRVVGTSIPSPHYGKHLVLTDDFMPGDKPYFLIEIFDLSFRGTTREFRTVITNDCVAFYVVGSQPKHSKIRTNCPVIETRLKHTCDIKYYFWVMPSNGDSITSWEVEMAKRAITEYRENWADSSAGGAVD